MAAGVGKVHCNTHLEWLTIKVGGAYIPPPRCAAARRDGAPVKLITVPWFLVWQWLEESGFEALRFSGRRRWRSFRWRLLFEIVDRKKEKRRRRSPCGLFLSRARACVWKGRRETSAVLRFDSSSLIDHGPRKRNGDRRAWDSSNVVIEPIRISNLRV